MVYLDNGATTKPSKICKSAVDYVLSECWANPSSLYDIGLNAEKIIKKAQREIANILNCSDSEIYFTSGGTEANNFAIKGVLQKYKNKNKNIVTTSIEHKSVLDVFKSFESDFKVTYVKPNKYGDIDCETILKHIDRDTVLLSVMHINNEIGTVFDVEEISKMAKKINADITIHCDGVQAFCKRKIDLNKTYIDLYSFSGHKIFAPKGIGGLYIRKKQKITPMFLGGEQQKKMRAGTENTAFINALCLCSKDYIDNLNKNTETVKNLYFYLCEKLQNITDVEVLTPKRHSPYIVSVFVKNIRSEILLHFLEEKGIYVSSGSACSKGKVSYVLKQLENGEKRANQSIRISFSYNNTFEDIDKLVYNIELAKKLIKN